MLKEFSPALTRMPDQDADFLEPADRNPELRRMADSAHEQALARGMRHGFEITYGDFTVNGKTLGFGDPIRVRAGERVLLHVANASATAVRGIALPAHTFHVVALDGNRVPTPHDVDVVWVGPGERVSATVRMSHPGKWILGDVGEDRWQGMGIVVEYANSSGAAQWTSPSSGSWDYTRFGGSAAPIRPDATIDLLFSEEEAAADGFNRWLINGVPFSMTHMEPRFRLQRGRRYRIRLRNASDDVHPLHLHRHTFQLTKVAGRPTSGVQKDVVMVGPYQELEIDFTADASGLSLFHCHMQLQWISGSWHFLIVPDRALSGSHGQEHTDLSRRASAVKQTKLFGKQRNPDSRAQARLQVCHSGKPPRVSGLQLGHGEGLIIGERQDEFGGSLFYDIGPGE